MIKFLCASCGERLSVPDQTGGRKGVCPTCQAINRIPLKGMAETQGTTVTARPPADVPPRSSVDRAGTAPDAAQPSTIPSPTPIVQPSVAPSAHDSTEGVEQESAEAAEPSQSTESAPPAATDRFTSPTKFVAPPDQAAVLRSMRRAKQEGAKPSLVPTPIASSRPEKPLPRNVKMALLILTALGIAAALYLALYFALNMVMKGLK